MTWKEVLIFGGVFIGWFLLVRWVLPYFGVPTCMSGSCSAVPRPTEYGAASPTDQTCPYCSGVEEKKPNEPLPPEDP